MSLTSVFRVGQILRGQARTFTLVKQLQESVWIATTPSLQSVVVKSVQRLRIHNERNVLRRFQTQALSLRPLIDEIEDPVDPPAIVMKYLDDDLLKVSGTRRLSRLEVKHVARNILEALQVLHEGGYVHTDFKPDNVLVNYGPGREGDVRFTAAELADCGNTVPADSIHAKDRYMIGAPLWRSPEAQLQIGWGTPTDIWSFGAVLITLIWSDNWFIFKPNVPADHDECELRILMKQHQFFGPFPLSYSEIANPETLGILTYILREVPREKMKPFERITAREISNENKSFLLKIMKLDPRDRPTAKDLLEDVWFKTE